MSNNVSISKNSFIVQSTQIIRKMKFLAAWSESYSKITPRHITAIAVVSLINCTVGISSSAVIDTWMFTQTSKS